MTTTKTRPNSYAGTCSRCGTHVAAQAGLLGPKVDGRWTVEHTECPAVDATATVRTTRRPRSTDSAQWVMGPRGMVRSRRRSNVGHTNPDE